MCASRAPGRLKTALGSADNAFVKVIPQTPAGVIAFAAVHQPRWEPEPEHIGLTKEQVAAMNDLLKAAQEKAAAARAARDASKAATSAMHTSVRQLRAYSANLVAAVKAYAASGGSEPLPSAQILAMAGIDVPDPGGGRARTTTPPGRPSKIETTVNTRGAVTITWTSANAGASTGGRFEIARRSAGEAGFRLIGIAPGSSRTRKRLTFTDETLPAGTASAQYIIVPQRGTASGEPSTVVHVEFFAGALCAAA